MVNAQQWLDEKYPVNRRNEITELDINKGKVKRWDGHERTLKGDLKLEGFTNLRSLICPGHELTNLDLSSCSNLIKIDCSNNNIGNLDLSACTELKEINCSSNIFLKELDISKSPEIITIKSDLSRDNGTSKLVKSSGSQVTSSGGDDIRNILIIGITGNGKSTLANVLTNTNQFTEKASSTSVTKNFQKSRTFEWQSKKYRIIDNIGFSDTANLSQDDVLFKIGEGIHSAREGINQIIFVFKDKFSREQIAAFKLFEDFINEVGITKFITLVRTNFDSFRNQLVCEDDYQALLNEEGELGNIISSCKELIHVDNPPNDKNNNSKELQTSLSKKNREKSRERVLNHLAENCSEIYKLKGWNSIYSRVEKYKKKKEEVEKKLIISQTKKAELENEKKSLVDEVRFRLGINPVTLDAFIEVGIAHPKCCMIS